MTKKNYFQISTAIDYPSGPPHVGHLYEKICTDIIARWNRLLGKTVHFSTGLDCHGSKIAKYARKANKSPKEFIEPIEKLFLELCTVYKISYDDFIKTTEERHKKVVINMINDLYKKGDIYKDKYCGYYCQECETYYSKKELSNENCPTHNIKVEFLEEESYFFKMGKYKSNLLDHIKNNPNFIRPIKKRNEILNRLNVSLNDLSVTREKINWGIPFPIEKKFVAAIWIDALINYLTTIGYPNKGYKDFWPALHIIGSDIVWHHSVIFGTWLLASKIELPEIYVHGFIRSSSGEKMSKSLGNVIDPFELAKKYPIDAVRYFLIRGIPFGQDGDFSEKALKDRSNNELANDLGNLLSRVLTIAEKKFNGKIMKNSINSKLTSKLNLSKIKNLMNDYNLTEALNEIWTFVKSCNKHINDEKIWEMQPKEQEKHLYTLLESLRLIALLLSPFIPETSGKIYAQLGVSYNNINEAKFGLIKQYMVKKGPILFNKIK